MCFVTILYQSILSIQLVQIIKLQKFFAISPVEVFVQYVLVGGLPGDLLLVLDTVYQN